MKKKSIFILLAVLVVLVVVVIIIEGPLSERSKKEAAKESILFPGFETDQVSSVDIKTQDKEVKLKKEDNTWVVATAGNYPADPKSIEDMLGKVRDLKSTLTASKSADKHSQFEVDESGVEVTMLGTGEKALAHFFVGKMGPDYISTYVRKADQDEVLLVGEYLRGVFDKGARGWRDRTVFDFDASQVQTLTLVSEEKGEMAIAAQEGGGWQITKPEVAPAEKEAVDDIVSEISKLEADDFAEQKEETTDPLKEYKLDKPQSKVVVDLTDGTARVLLIGDESGYRRYAKREDKDIVFLVSKSKIDRIFKDIEELKAEVEEGKESEPEETP
jgi:flagellar basal body-associated protein FliL